MAAWLPLLKAALPYVTDIISAALPVFTQNRANKAAGIVDQQIAELQASVTHNAESVKALALQLERTIVAVDSGAVSIEQTSEQFRATLESHSQAIARIEKLERSLWLTNILAILAALGALAMAFVHFR